MLKVSEASVRRWSDAGWLPVERFGLRGERRFQEEDIRRFLDQGLQRSAREPAAVALAGVHIRLGTHLATFYDSDAARLRLTVPFLSEGIRQGNGCLLVAAGRVLDAYLEKLDGETGVDVDAASRSGTFATTHGLGKSSAEASERWEELAWSTLGPSSGMLRVVGEMTDALHQSSPGELVRFEDGLNSVIKRFRAVVVCQYDAREFDGEAMLSAIKTHPDIFELNLGRLIG
jgi:hypothetical protein